MKDNKGSVCENAKTLKENSFLMDVNVIEAPLFRFQTKKLTTKVRDLEKSSLISEEMKYILGRIPEENKGSIVEFATWNDSKGLRRELLTTSMFKFPNGFCMDVFYAVIALYIKQHSPISFSSELKKYDIKSQKVEFTLFELCEFMGLAVGGRSYQRIKDALREIDAVKYYSLANGVLYDKNNESYVINKEKSINLIETYSVIEKSSKRGEKCSVTLGELVLKNIENSFIKFLNHNTYFKLKTGLTRRLYTYLEANMYINNGKKQYIKRSIEVLKNKIPVDVKFKSEFKKKLKSPLENLIKEKIISSYFYGDEILINGAKEDCIYFIFQGTKQDVIDKLTIKTTDDNDDKDDNNLEESKLELPKDFKESLINIGFSEGKADDLISKYTKWKLAEYILWIEDLIKNNKAKNPPAMVVFGLEQGMVVVSKTHPQITKFVKEEKDKEEGKKIVDEKIIKKAYEEYLEKNLKSFNDDPMYEMISISVVGELEDICADRIKMAKKMYNYAANKTEKDKFMSNIEKWEQFNLAEDKTETEVYKEEFNKRAVIYLQLDLYEDFKRKFKIK